MVVLSLQTSNCTRLDIGQPSRILSKHSLMPLKSSDRTRLSAAERRQAILEVARRVFGAGGYHQATTREIAGAAGVSEALLYQHFPSKRRLFEELILLAGQDLERRLRDARSAPDPGTAAVAAYFDFVEQESDMYRVFFREALQMDPTFRALYLDLSNRLVHLLDGRRETPEVVVHALSGMITELALWWVEERRLTKEQMIAEASRLSAALSRTGT